MQCPNAVAAPGDVAQVGERKAKNGRVAVLYRFGDLAALIERVREEAKDRVPFGTIYRKSWHGGQ